MLKLLSSTLTSACCQLRSCYMSLKLVSAESCKIDCYRSISSMAIAESWFILRTQITISITIIITTTYLFSASRSCFFSSMSFNSIFAFFISYSFATLLCQYIFSRNLLRLAMISIESCMLSNKSQFPWHAATMIFLLIFSRAIWPRG